MTSSVSPFVSQRGNGTSHQEAAGADLRFQRALLQAQSEASLDGMLVVGPDGTVLSFNRRYLEMWGLSEEMLASGTSAQALRAVQSKLVDPPAFLARIEHLYARPHETSHDELILKDGRLLDRYSAPVIDAEGTYLGRVWLFRDVTASKQAEAARVALAQEQAAREAAVQRSARLHALHRAALELSSFHTPQPQATATLLGAIVHQAVSALRAHDGWVVLAEDPVWRDLVPGSGPADGPIILDFAGLLRRRRLRPDGAEAHVLETGETVEVPDTRVAARFGPYPQLAEVGIRAFATAPLRAGGSVLGVLGVTFRPSGHLAAEEREVLELFAAHAAAAVDRARLVHAERRRATQAERLAGVLAQVGAAADVEGGVEALLRGAISLLEGECGVARLFTPKARRQPVLWAKCTSGVVERSMAPRPAPGSFAATLEAGGPPVLVEDVAALDPAVYPPDEGARSSGMRASVNVPIPGGERPIGSLHVYHHQPGFFGYADMALANALATHAQAAIERVLLETARRAAEAAREQAVGALARQTEEATKREAEAAALREMDRLKDELLSTIAHELRTPLSVIYGYAQRLQGRAANLDSATIERTTERMLTAATQLKRLVEDLLDFGRMQRGEVAVRVETCDLAPVLRGVLEAVKDQPGGERVVGTWPPQLLVCADPARVAQAIENLLENALRYAPEGPIVLCAGPAGRDDESDDQAEGQAGEQANGQMVRVAVEDHGPGIPYEEQQRVWEKFFRGAGVAGLNVARGSGIGLAVVKALVEAQGGRVGLESTPGRGATFWFDLPRGGAAGIYC